MKFQIDISKKLQPLLKSARKVGKVVSEEASKAARTLGDIESGKLKIVCTVTTKRTK